jgi:hypothetical protein
LGKGRYLKAAEQSCSRKARFDSAADAERACEWRFRAYQCPVCHHFHLTSRPGPLETQPTPEPLPRDLKGPKLADLDWSNALDPKPKAPRPSKPKKAVVNPPPPPAPPPIVAKCVRAKGKDGRVHLLLEGRLVKSAPVRDAALAEKLREGAEVLLAPETTPPIILNVR